MKTLQRLIPAGLIVVSFMIIIAATQCQADDITITIDVAPNVINIQSKSTVVTVHTDIASDAVDGYSVSLNGVDINYWKSDNQGNFVAKFLADDIKTLAGLIIGDYNTLTLKVYDDEGTYFIGTQDIKVIDVGPKK